MNARLGARLAAARRWRMQPPPSLAADRLREIRAERKALNRRILRRVGWFAVGFGLAFVIEGVL